MGTNGIFITLIKKIESNEMNYANMSEYLNNGNPENAITTSQDLQINIQIPASEIPEINIHNKKSPIQIHVNHFKPKLHDQYKTFLEETKSDVVDNLKCTMIEQRKNVDIKSLRQELKSKNRTEEKKNTSYKLELKELIRCLSNILKDYIISGDLLSIHNKATLLFNDEKYSKRQWNITIFTGFSSTLPIVRYHIFREKQKYPAVQVDEIRKFIKTLYEKIKPPIECAVISLIYVERLMVFFRIWDKKFNRVKEFL